MPTQRPAMRLALLIALALPSPALAQVPGMAGQELMALVRASRWNEAALLASQAADPVAAKLVRWFRLLAPSAASAAEITEFIADSPDWPLAATLARRRDEALAVEPDDAVAAGLCTPMPQASPALARCADAFTRLGNTDAAASAARAAWTAALADPAWEVQFLARWSAVLREADHVKRYERLSATSDLASTQRQIARLNASHRGVAEARLALRRDDPGAEALLARLDAAQLADPGLVLERARALRRAGADDAAVALWRSTAGDRVESRAEAEQQSAFWDERNLLARRRLRQNDAAGAYALAAGHGLTGSERRLDAEFLAGYIALRLLRDPSRATRHFETLAQSSKSSITLGRAQYWLGRSTGDIAHFRQAAGAPNTYYGQLAILALGEDPAAHIAAARDPPADADRVLDFAGRELARASALLAAWGEPRRARPFLLRLVDVAPDPPDRALAGRLAAGFGLPDTAVAIARRAGSLGVVLLDTGWPVLEALPGGVDPALTLAVIRQESSFDAGVVSPAGARGLMQLMPATATQLARRLGLATALPSLTGDPALNMRLGVAYLRDLLDGFDNAVPLAVAAYNAGPSRVRDWLATNGDPRLPGVDMIDWIELIPFNETRNYVQRVVENIVIYQARFAASPHASGPVSQAGGAAPVHPLSRWLR